jgi:hypothetical protein
LTKEDAAQVKTAHSQAGFPVHFRKNASRARGDAIRVFREDAQQPYCKCKALPDLSSPEYAGLVTALFGPSFGS